MKANVYCAIKDLKKLNIKKGNIFIQVLPGIDIIREKNGTVYLELVEENNKFFKKCSDIEFKDSPFFKDACKMAEQEKEKQEYVLKVTKKRIDFCNKVLALRDKVDEIEQRR